MHIVLDTSIFSADRTRSSAAFKTLERLSVGGQVKLVLPYHVKHEFIGQEAEQISAAWSKIRQGRRELERRTLVPGDLQEVMSRDRLRIEESRASALALSTFERWLRDVRGRVLELDADIGARVSERYFRGLPPFKKVRNRQDLPDAFILESILAFVSNEVSKDETVIVVNDNALRKACEDEGLKCYSSLHDLMSSDLIMPLLVKHFSERNLAILREVESELNQIASSIDADMMIGVLERSGLPVPEPGEGDGYLQSGGLLSDIMLDWSSADYYGDGVIVLPFEATLDDVLVSYSIFKADYHVLGEERASGISISECNRHYYDAEEHISVRVCGEVSLEISPERFENEELERSDLLDLLPEATVKFDSVSEIELLEPRWRVLLD